MHSTSKNTRNSYWNLQTTSVKLWYKERVTFYKKGI